MWALRITGVGGILLSLPTLPIMWGTITGRANIAIAYGGMMGLPWWARWDAVTGTGIVPMLGGAICALLVVSGRWPSRVLAAVTVAVLVYSEVAISGASYWANWMAANLDGTPASVVACAVGAVLLTASVTALVLASRSGPSTGEASG
jgi:hypothetical protein